KFWILTSNNEVVTISDHTLVRAGNVLVFVIQNSARVAQNGALLNYEVPIVKVLDKNFLGLFY
ncbi:hypothetical protein BS585_17030, partial [Vibrio parahaemolyticus]